MHPTIARARLGPSRTTQDQLDYFRRLGRSARNADRGPRRSRPFGTVPARSAPFPPVRRRSR